MANLTNLAEDAILNAYKGTPFSVATLHARLHTGDPTDAGTANGATNTTRVSITLGTVTGGTVSNTNALAWTSVPATETYSHVVLLSAATGGDAHWQGALTTPVAVTAGNNFTIPIGDLDLAMV